MTAPTPQTPQTPQATPPPQTAPTLPTPPTAPTAAEPTLDTPSVPDRTLGSILPLPGPAGGLPPGDRLKVYLEATRLHGDVLCVNAAATVFLVSHPDHVKRVLQDNQQNYRQTVRKRVLMGRQSLTLSSGEAWRQRRRLMQPLFRAQRLQRLAGRMTTESELLAERWRGAAERGEPVDVAEEMIRLTLDILIGLLMSDDAGRGGRLRRAAATAFEFFSARTIRPSRLPDWMPTPGKLRLARALAELKGSVSATVAERRGGEGQDNDLLSMLIAARDEQSGGVMDDEQLKDELMMLLVMGHMTTAMAVTWLWYLLGRHPEVEERVRAEIAAVVGDRAPELRDVAGLAYTRRVVDETLRLYPPSWTFDRFANADDEIGGRRIPADATVLISPYVTHRRPDLWEDPDRFDPDRFLPERAAARPRFAYYPFGGGPRVCIARDLALTELPLILATVARSFRLRPIPGRRIVPQTALVLRPRGGLPMRLEALHPAAGETAGAAAPALATLAELALLAAGRPQAVLYKRDGGYAALSGDELLRRVGLLARALLRLGLAPGEVVALAAGNGPHWPAIDLAVMCAGGVTAAIHPNLPGDEAQRQLRESGAVIAFAGGADRLTEIAAAAARGELPRLRHRIAVDAGGAAAGPPWIALQELLGGGGGQAPEAPAPPALAELTALVRQRRPEDPAALVFSAGATGPPRPWLLTHGNLVANVLALAAVLDVRKGDTAFSYLPLADPFQRALHYLYLYRGATVAFAGSEATAAADLLQVQPHVVSTAADFWKGYLNDLFATFHGNRGERRFQWAVQIGRVALPWRLRRERPPGHLGRLLKAADLLVFNKLRRQRLGRRFRFAVSGGPGVSHGYITFLWAAGVPVFEGYGLAAAGIAALNSFAALVPGSSGAPLPGVEIRLDAGGEVLVRSPAIGRPAAAAAGAAAAAAGSGATGTAAGGASAAPALDAAGWLHTGDLGFLDDASMLNLLGRRDEVFRDAAGVTIGAGRLASQVRCTHTIAQAVVVGEGRDSLGALIVPDFEVLGRLCRRRGIDAATPREMVAHPQARRILEADLASINQKLAAHEQIKVWDLLPDEWSAASGELTAAGTVRRDVVLDRYAAVIARLYAPAAVQT
jgi:long-subunit acyl-CoA synthetase (AMP-forming)/cytochrome P450